MSIDIYCGTCSQIVFHQSAYELSSLARGNRAPSDGDGDVARSASVESTALSLPCTAGPSAMGATIDTGSAAGAGAHNGTAAAVIGATAAVA